MENKRHQYLLNVVFLAGLLLLALNDHVFKGAYGNWWTGKLSDFAGVLILPLFLAYVFRLGKRTAVAATVVLFTTFKSGYSQPMIDAWNGLGLFHLGRVVDYSDLLAFMVLPLSYRVLSRPEDYALRLQFPRQVSRYALLPLTLLFFVATSPPDSYIIIGPEIGSCCQEPPAIDSLGGGRLFIPTAFTPDGDGLNDRFQVIADEGIARIDTFFVVSLIDGDTVFRAENVTDISPATGWDGSDAGVTEASNYQFDIRLSAVDGSRRAYRGYVCALPCREPTGMARPVNLEVCGFADEIDLSTIFSDSLTTSEILDCFVE
jgi:hypothetical protein